MTKGFFDSREERCVVVPNWYNPYMTQLMDRTTTHTKIPEPPSWEAAIPIAYIEQQLMEFPIDKAWEIFQTLNELLEDNEIWREHDRSIRSQLKERMMQKEVSQSRATTLLERAANRPTAYYASGSTHNDYSRHLNMGENIIPVPTKQELA
ncbi:MAG: hypothetical protein K6A94_10315 [Bacteroidales bacterium]|nr:hypothetical protein [Bacteroidales bacterium]